MPGCWSPDHEVKLCVMWIGYASSRRLPRCRSSGVHRAAHAYSGLLFQLSSGSVAHLLDSHLILEPLINLGIFAPALVSIGLSALLQPRPRRVRRKTAIVAFIVTWFAAAVVIGVDRIVIGGAHLSTLPVAVCVVTAMLPPFIVEHSDEDRATDARVQLAARSNTRHNVSSSASWG